MKKVLALVLSLCMLLSCAAFAESGFSGQLKVDVQGQNQVDYTFSIAQDEDGCLQLSANGTADGSANDIFLQIGQQALVLGSQGEYAEINYQDLIAALKNALPQALTEEQLAVIGIIYYLFTGLEDDMQIVSDVLSNEMTRLLGTGMQQGVITYSRDGIVFEADQDQLLNLFKGYIAALAQDPTVLENLSKTQLWSLLGLSENGVQEQAYLTAFSDQVAQLALPGTFTLYIKAVIGMEGSFTLDVDFATTDGTNSVNLDAAFSAEGTATCSLVASVDGTDINAAINAYSDGAAQKLEGSLEIEDISGKLVMDGEMVAEGAKLSSTCGLNFTSNNEAINASAKYDADFANKEIAASVDAEITVNGETGTIDLDYTCDKVNGLYCGLLVTDPNGVRNGAYITGNAQTTEYGAQALLNVDLVMNDQPIDSIFACEAVLSDVIDIHAHLNSIRSDVDTTYYESWNEYGVSYEDLWNGYQSTYVNKDEYEANPEAYAEGLYNLFNLDASLNLENAKLDAALTYDGHTLALEGAASADAYTLIAAADDEVLATAVLQLLPGQPILNSLLLGQLTIELYNGTRIERTTKMDGNTVSWMFTVTDAQGTTQQIEIGIRNKSEGSRQNYELYVLSQGMEEAIGIVFEQASDRIFFELYANIVSGTYSMNVLDATLELRPITEAPAHVTGQPIPQSYLEQMLVSVLSQISREIDRAF